ncbi:MAG TPA: cytochrome c oxidase assembly protein [Xanthobacteraceae bacterium]|jgi:putative membrane protein
MAIYTADHLPYCGAPPVPAGLWGSWNLDPVLISALLGIGIAYAASQHWARRNSDRVRGPWEETFFYAGWIIGSLAVISPLCPLSVALFAARVGQHMILTLIAAPLIILGRPSVMFEALAAAIPQSKVFGCFGRPARVLASAPAATILFAAFLWLWHAPGPYDATFESDLTYWTMHVTLFGSALLLWSALLDTGFSGRLKAIGCGFATSIHMGILGFLITFASRALYAAHFGTTWPWGLSELQDQQLGGLIMWIPGCGVFLIAAAFTFCELLRSLDHSSLDEVSSISRGRP